MSQLDNRPDDLKERIVGQWCCNINIFVIMEET